MKKLKRKSPYLTRKLWPGLLVTAIGSRELYWDLEIFLLWIPYSLESLTNNTSTNYSHRPGDRHANLSNWSLFWETSGVQFSSGQVVLQQVLTSFQVYNVRRHNQEWVMMARRTHFVSHFNLLRPTRIVPPSSFPFLIVSNFYHVPCMLFGYLPSGFRVNSILPCVW